jgi:hypothetical protein
MGHSAGKVKMAHVPKGTAKRQGVSFAKTDGSVQVEAGRGEVISVSDDLLVLNMDQYRNP